MAMRSLMPWGGGGRSLASRPSGDENPFLSFHREMNRMFDEFMRGFDLAPLPSAWAGGGWSGTWPHVELTESDNEVRVVAELPGMDEKDVELTLDDNLLTLKGEKKAENESPTYSERWHGRFTRTIPLGAEVDPDKIEAAFRNGVLTVTIPKRPESQSKAKRIAIKTD